MSTARSFVWISILALACAGPARADRPVSESVAAHKDAEVEIEIVAGRVEVVAWDEARVTVEGTIGDDVEEVAVEGEGSHIEIVVKTPDNGRRRMRDADANLTIQVPRGARVEVESLSADVTITGISGDVNAETVSGDIEITTGSNRIEVASVSGDLRVNAPAKELEAEAVSGDITIAGVSGNATVEVVSGDVKLEGSLLKAEIEAVSGDIDVRATLLGGADVEINSLSGTVDLAVPASVSARFRVETFSGSVASDFGNPVRSGEHSSGMRLDTTAGSGDARVRIECFSGRVKIKTQ